MQKCGIQVEVGNRVWSSGKKCKCESDSRRDGVGSGMPAWDYPRDRVDTVCLGLIANNVNFFNPLPEIVQNVTHEQ